MLAIEWQQEAFNAALGILVAAITLGLGWLVGQRLTVYWAIRQKRRELELAAVTEFYGLYGEFFAIWKLWACYLASRDKATTDAGRWEVLQRACSAEGALEALLVKVSSEKELSSEDVKVLGRFRQAFQTLREAIRDNVDVGWYSHDHPGYLTFKRLAHLVSLIILARAQRKQSAAHRTGNSLEEITSNTWESAWLLNDDDWTRLQDHYRNRT